MEDTVGSPVDIDVEFSVDVEVDLAHDTSSMAATIKKIKPHQMNFLFILPPSFLYMNFDNV